MKSDQSTISSSSQSVTESYYQLGLNHLKNQIDEVFATLETYTLEFDEDHLKVFNQAKLIKSKIDSFCSCHLSLLSYLTHFKDDSLAVGGLEELNKAISGRISKLKSRLKSTKRKSRKIDKMNVKLKQRIRDLKGRLREVAEGGTESSQQDHHDCQKGFSLLSNKLDLSVATTEVSQNLIAKVLAYMEKEHKKKQITESRRSSEPGRIPKREKPLLWRPPELDLKMLTYDPGNMSTKSSERGGGEEMEEIDLARRRPLQATATIKAIRRLHEGGIIGGSHTYLAMKNPTSFLVGTWGAGLKLYENNCKIYSATLPEKEHWLKDIIYVKPLNGYIIAHDEKLYFKKIDSTPPSLFMAIRAGLRSGTSLRYSKKQQKLVISRDWKYISFINLMQRKVEFEMDKTVGDSIIDFRLLSDADSRVAALTKDGHLVLYAVNYRLKSGYVLDSYNLGLKTERNECGLTLAACPESSYLMAEIGYIGRPGRSSRVAVFEINERKTLTMKAVINHGFEIVMSKYSLECYGYAGDHLFWVGLTNSEEGIAQIYDYNTLTGQLSELVGKRVFHGEENPNRLVRLEDRFYYIGSKGKLMRLGLAISN